ncbi:MAG TPA: hypothetical protein VLD67_18920, partial [Vicinamibacterales bacterium]|nr:hypothetical protein [Vicinamibacterales bacterium]
MRSYLTVLAAVAAGVMTASTPEGRSQEPQRDEARDRAPAWDTTMARGTTRDIEFTTSEGTWMSTDISPDGRWIVFDLLAHIYRVPADGGTAECLTADSGAAINFHPRFSPDGRHIA